MPRHRVRRNTSPPGRRASRVARAGVARALVTGLALLALAGAAVAGAAACGGSSSGSGASPTAASAPSPVSIYPPGPLPRRAMTVLDRFFEAVAAGDSEAAAALLTPNSPLRDNPTMSIATIRDVTVHRRPLATPPTGASAMPMVSAWVEGEAESTWGPGGRRDFFMAVTEAPAGVWLVDHMATGP